MGDYTELLDSLQDVYQVLQRRISDTQTVAQAELLEEVQRAITVCHQELLKVMSFREALSQEDIDWSMDQIIKLLQKCYLSGCSGL